MEIATGDESCRDRPIYVRVTCCGEKNTNCWYVIEEKPLGAESSSSSSSAESSSSSSSSDIDEEDGNDKEDGNDILMECKSKSDRIRRLSVPDSELRYNSLAVLNSRIYLIGGDIDIEMIKDEEIIGYRHLDLEGKRQWLLDGGKLIDEQYGAAAVGHDGFIYSVGCQQYRLSPEGGILEKLPTPPPLSRLREEYRTCESRLLSLTKRKLFIYIIAMGPNHSNLMLSYDLETGEWDEDYNNFSGLWSAGVVLYNDRYLFSLGSQNPLSPAVYGCERVQQVVVPGIYVFDIKRRQWLPEPVEGLRTDGTVLPYDYQTRPEVRDIGPCYSPYLFQIGKHNDHKLALLWESQRPHPESGLPRCLLIWSKFILNASTTVPTSSDQIPHFYADSLSNGFCPLDEWTDQLLNCAAGMGIGPAEKQAKD
ncbi:hypothetical protein ABKV19_002136 [Rosa sericea]